MGVQKRVNDCGHVYKIPLCVRKCALLLIPGKSLISWRYFTWCIICYLVTKLCPTLLWLQLTDILILFICEWLCSAHREIIWPCPCVNGYRKDINTPLPKAGPSQRCFARWKTLFTFLLHFVSLSILPFDFREVMRNFSLWLYKRTWNPDPDEMVTLTN